MDVWAIVVGINKYPDQTKQTELKGAVDDACDFAEWVLDPHGGNVPPERLYFWTHPWPNAPGGRLGAFLNGAQTPWVFDDESRNVPDQSRAPTATEIVETAQTVGRTARHAASQPGAVNPAIRRIYVFFAGHGVRAQEFKSADQTCFLAKDFRRLTGNSILGVVACDSFRDALLIDRFNEVIMFLDCCRLSPLKLQEQVVPLTDRAKVTGGSVWGVGHAAQRDKAAFETTEAPFRGAFSKTLMEGLRGLREGPNQELHMEPLKAYVQTAIKAHTAQPQMPSILYDPDALPGPLIVAGPPTGAAVSLHLTGPKVYLNKLPLGMQLVLKDGTKKVVAGVEPLVAGENPVQLPPLPPGLYLIEVADDPARKKIFSHPEEAEVHVE
jgi:uncharacterized caspase-like protein